MRLDGPFIYVGLRLTYPEDEAAAVTGEVVFVTCGLELESERTALRDVVGKKLLVRTSVVEGWRSRPASTELDRVVTDEVTGGVLVLLDVLHTGAKSQYAITIRNGSLRTGIE